MAAPDGGYSPTAGRLGQPRSAFGDSDARRNMISDFVKLVPKSILDRSGEVFLSGRRAFGSPSDLYILGLNPAGDPTGSYTVSRNIDMVLNHHPDNWSAYRDDRWRNLGPGKSPMQRRMLYLLKRVGRDPSDVPASETIFLRNTDWTQLGDLKSLARECWPFHQAVVDKLNVRVIACLGRHAGSWARRQLNAHKLVGEFVESNRRLWRSRAHVNADGLTVVTLSHPSQAAWTVPASDPTGLVETALKC